MNVTHDKTNKKLYPKTPNSIFKQIFEIYPYEIKRTYNARTNYTIQFVPSWPLIEPIITFRTNCLNNGRHVNIHPKDLAIQYAQMGNDQSMNCTPYLIVRIVEQGTQLPTLIHVLDNL
jgi:hypothetical protein